MSRAKLCRLGTGTALVLVALLGAAALAHTSSGRRAWVNVTGQACPFGGRATSAAELHEQARSDDMSLRGVHRAMQRPALGFSLASTDRATFEGWAQASGAHCFERDQALSLECAGTPLPGLSEGRVDTRGTLWARFDPSGRLREVTAISRADTSADASWALASLTRQLSDLVGPPHARHGEASEAYLARGGLTQAAVEYRFSDYYVRLAVTNMGAGDGFRILQRYRALEN